ncbi:MAG: hypothetical protein EOP52_13985 [Sphingobacteriales bacterium]|nr:MAG: hypothetical protein EOP52_13985 [Sphingobacteriales bacterium]
MGVALKGVEQQKAIVKRDRALAIWKSHCERAGEFIEKVVPSVEGISNQYAYYIASFLRGGHAQSRDGKPPPGWPPHTGYAFVEARDLSDGNLYRYTGEILEPWQTDKNYVKGYTKFAMKRVRIPAITASYGVEFEDISSKQDRDYWIAGGSLRVVDLATNLKIAERVGYMVDVAQGSSSGGRSPWLFAADHACPEFNRDFNFPNKSGTRLFSYQLSQSERFVEKVLKPAP